MTSARVTVAVIAVVQLQQQHPAAAAVFVILMEIFAVFVSEADITATDASAVCPTVAL